MTQPASYLIEQYLSTRQRTRSLCAPLSAEDMQAQSMPDASPLKWHLGHTTWFFECFLLQATAASHYRESYDPLFLPLFNSYYESAGQRHARPERGLLTRPSMDQVWAYRQHVDDAVMQLLDGGPSAHQCAIVETGLHHEMQHQELMMTDLLHLFSRNPLRPAAFQSKPYPTHGTPECALRFHEFAGGLHFIGDKGEHFAYDCERPMHKVYLPPFHIANRLVTNAEWLAFIEDGGYRQPLLWLSDGWDWVNREQWQAPLYWEAHDGTWMSFGLDGLQPMVPDAPVSHISYYEADAFARWAAKRLPTEFELEHVAKEHSLEGNFLERQHWRPKPASTDTGVQQLYGDVWEWTQSAYAPYPGFRPEQGALGEYNGKFMINQMVLKGGSCVTPKQQIRASYRNFFHPHQRWQFAGLRLAEDV